MFVRSKQKKVLKFDHQLVTMFEFVRCSIKWCSTHHYKTSLIKGLMMPIENVFISFASSVCSKVCNATLTLPSVGLIHILLPVSVDVLRIKSLFNNLLINIELYYSEQRLYHSRCIFHLSNQTLGSYRIHLRYKVGQRPKKLKHVNEPNYCN